MKDEVTHKQDFAIFEHRFKQLQQLKEEVNTYKTLLKEEINTNFVAIPEHVLSHLPMDQYYTNDEILKDLLEQYTSLLKDYDRIKNRNLIQRLFNID
jgi:hypothetical protein